MPGVIDQVSADRYAMYHGDCIEIIKDVPSESVGLTVFSPPFPGMYAYSDSPRDIGNCRGTEEMLAHFAFVVPDLLRVTQPGRMCCVHLCQLTTMKSREGYIGLYDYRGDVIRLFVEHGWRFAGEVTIDKNPQIQAVRNKERGLLFKTLATDSSLMRMALADYVVYFRKEGEGTFPIRAGLSERYNPDGEGWITEEEWIEWAAPVWYRQIAGYPGGIRETDVLNVRCARESDDERHLCPLQLGVIERCIKLWSAPDETVFSPFAGIGSEGYKALLLGRRFIGIELKPSYYKVACENLDWAEREHRAGTADLIDWAKSQGDTAEAEPDPIQPTSPLVKHAATKGPLPDPDQCPPLQATCPKCAHEFPQRRCYGCEWSGGKYPDEWAETEAAYLAKGGA